MEIHHIIPREDGGSDDPDNLTPLCDPCHDDWHRWYARRVPFTQWAAEIPAHKLQRALAAISATADASQVSAAQAATAIAHAWALYREMELAPHDAEDEPRAEKPGRKKQPAHEPSPSPNAEDIDPEQARQSLRDVYALILSAARRARATSGHDNDQSDCGEEAE